MRKNLLFTYGSLILNKHNLGFKMKPVMSVFVRGYKLIIEKSSISKKNYHYIKLVKIKDKRDIVSGFLVEISTSQLNRLDKYEGLSYNRKEINCYDRELKKYKVFAYISSKPRE